MSAASGSSPWRIATNLPMQRFIAAHPDFAANRIDTRWLEQTGLPAFAQDKDC